jgi:hypothetical protein
VWDFKQQIVIIVAVTCIVPSYQVLVDIIDVAANVGKWMPTKLELRYIRKDLGIRGEVNVLRFTLRLQR